MEQILFSMLCTLITLVLLFIQTTTCSNVNWPNPFLRLNLNQSEGVAIDTRRVRRRLSLGPEQTPLFQGMGVHYSFIWVGTPPQRVSVIVDTGSHHTAFPCVGCKCGKHMDPFWDPSKSSTATVMSCNGNKCFFRQSYSEGSSWNAFKVQDKLWMGGQNIEHIPSANKWSINFDFGCQDSETGLFRTQNIDGIMGMSAASNTLPYQLMSQSITSTKMFAMCFRIGGGILTLGGIDRSLHSYKGNWSSVAMAKMVKPKGWFTVRLIDILMKPQLQGSGSKLTTTSIGVQNSKLNSGKGTIVDSGTTDTYLPRSVEISFRNLFKSMSGG